MVFEIELAALLHTTVPTFLPLPKQQSVWRDIAVMADEAVSHEALMKAILERSPGSLIRSANLFDVFRPPVAAGSPTSTERSLAVRLELRDDEATLTDERIDAAVAAGARNIAHAARRATARVMTMNDDSTPAMMLSSLDTPTLTKAEWPICCSSAWV